MKKNIEWLRKELVRREDNFVKLAEIEQGVDYSSGKQVATRQAINLIDQLDEPEVLSREFIDKYKVDYDNWMPAVPIVHLQNLLVPKQKLVEENKRLNGLLITMQEEVDQAYRKGFKEGERQTAEYFESITEEPSKEQVWKYLSEHGLEVVDKEPETVASVIADFYKSLERLKGVLGTEVEELEE